MKKVNALRGWMGWPPGKQMANGKARPGGESTQGALELNPEAKAFGLTISRYLRSAIQR